MTVDYEGIANAALVFVTGLILWFGGRKGLAGAKPAEKVPEGETKAFKLDMAMVDNRAVEALAGSLEAVNMTLLQTNKLIETEMREREMDEAEQRGYDRALREKDGK